MALTKDFRETVRERAQQEPKFRKALLREAIEMMLSGDEKTGRAILRNYINAKVAFERLSRAVAVFRSDLRSCVDPLRLDRTVFEYYLSLIKPKIFLDTQVVSILARSNAGLRDSVWEIDQKSIQVRHLSAHHVQVANRY